MNRARKRRAGVEVHRLSNVTNSHGGASWARGIAPAKSEIRKFLVLRTRLLSLASGISSPI